MGTDYAKKKNAELEELLKSRSLPHTGKKAELIARLQEYDTKQSSAAESSATTATAAGDEDQIDWDDDVPTASAPLVGSAPSGTAAIAAGGQGQVANPTAVPNQAVDTDPSKTQDLTVNPPAPASDTTTKGDTEKPAEKADEAPLAPPTDFTSGLHSSNVEDEISKRQKRAARFGIQEDSTDALKALERAKKFGTGSEGDKSAVKGLDEALPERVKKERGLKRGREESKDTRPASKRRESGKRDNARPTRNARSGSRPQTKDKGGRLSEKDKLAAEARKKRFATAV